MSKSWEFLRKRMTDLLAPYGAVSDFCRKTGFGRTSVDSWLSDKNVPHFSQLDKIAEGLGLTPPDAIRPINEPVLQKDPLAEKLSDPIIREVIANFISLDEVQREGFRNQLALVAKATAKQSSVKNKKVR